MCFTLNPNCGILWYSFLLAMILFVLNFYQYNSVVLGEFTQLTSGYKNRDIDLMGVLEEKNNEHGYLNKLRELSIWTERHLTNPMIKDYTDHGVNHSRRLEGYINDLIQELMQGPNRLCDKEIYILLASCYLHDLGMHYQYLESLPYFDKLQNEYPNVNFSKRDNLNPEERQRILEVTRKEHNRISHELIMAGSIYGDLATPINGLDQELKHFVATICYGHRLNREEYDELGDESSGSDSIRRSLLARLLRIGDALDVTRERIDMQKMAFQYINDYSKVHWYKHHYTTGMQVSDRNRISLSFNLPCKPDDKTRRLYDNIPRWVIDELKLEEYLHVDYLDRYGIAIKIDERRNTNYKDNAELGSDVTRQPRSLLNPQPPLEEMDESLLELAAGSYEKFKEKNVDSMLML
ncbi:hypothetical protein GF312_04190 [Candidatus Poribacteria bacterium]|nr:hypothetical protein [Candidatus Poribacteria bacterium]